MVQAAESGIILMMDEIVIPRSLRIEITLQGDPQYFHKLPYCPFSQTKSDNIRKRLIESMSNLKIAGGRLSLAMPTSYRQKDIWIICAKVGPYLARFDLCDISRIVVFQASIVEGFVLFERLKIARACRAGPKGFPSIEARI